MADELTDEETDEDLNLEPQEAGLAFKAEMWAMDTMLGYWPYLLGVIVVGLIAIFFYGQYTNYQQRTQRAGAEAVAQVESKLPEPVTSLAFRQMSGAEIDIEAVVEAAVKLEGLEVTGPARVEALLKAGELYRLAGKTEEQRRVLEAAAGEGTGVLGFVAESAIANLDLESGQNQAAIERLSKLSKAHSDYLGEQATLDLAMVHEQLGQEAEARALYGEFLERWPESPRKDEVAKRRDALGEG